MAVSIPTVSTRWGAPKGQGTLARLRQRSETHVGTSLLKIRCMVSSRHARLTPFKDVANAAPENAPRCRCDCVLLVLAVSVSSHAVRGKLAKHRPVADPVDLRTSRPRPKLNQGPNVQTSLPTLIAAANDGTSATIPDECVNDSTAPTPLPTTIATTCAFGDKTASRRPSFSSETPRLRCGFPRSTWPGRCSIGRLSLWPKTAAAPGSARSRHRRIRRL